MQQRLKQCAGDEEEEGIREREREGDDTNADTFTNIYADYFIF